MILINSIIFYYNPILYFHGFIFHKSVNICQKPVTVYLS